MQPLQDLLKECEALHGHMCAGQLLGARMAMLGCGLIEVEDPRGRDRRNLIVWVEIDRCMADAVSAVTGVRLGKRSLKYLDYGKVAATFLNCANDKAVRIVALESSRSYADERYSELPDKRERQFRAYSEATDSQLFKVERVGIKLGINDEPGRPRSRVLCSLCGEGVNDGREVHTPEGTSVCRPCAEGAYYSIEEPLATG
jgi:formylmethanofuran dehydrogenase subunit E